MSRLWRGISLLCVKDDCTIGTRFMLRRCLSVSARRCDNTQEQEDDPVGQKTKPAKTGPKASAAASGDLMSALAGLKVKKTIAGSKQEKVQRQRSAAADFRDLLNRRRAGDESKESAASESQEDVQRVIVEKAKEVAEIFPQKDVVESELLRQLRRHDEATAAGKQGDVDAVSSILSGIKVERQSTLEREEDRRISHDERALAGTFGKGFEAIVDRRGQDPASERLMEEEAAKRPRRKVAFERHRLNIFKATAETDGDTQVAVTELESTPPTLWDKEEAKTLKMLSYTTLNSGFDEMMKWTEEGKVWHYPVDNEQGLEEEQAVPFQDHLFFDHLLEDLPQIEAILNFMELVCLGLSKNPYLTVQQKHDHIHWFKAYFKEREEVIKEGVEKERVEEARGAGL